MMPDCLENAHDKESNEANLRRHRSHAHQTEEAEYTRNHGQQKKEDRVLEHAFSLCLDRTSLSKKLIFHLERGHRCFCHFSSTLRTQYALARRGAGGILREGRPGYRDHAALTL